MSDKQREITDILSPEQVATQCNRSTSQIYQALAFGKLTEAEMPDWVNKKGIVKDSLLKEYAANCKRLDDKKANKVAEVDEIGLAKYRLERAKAKAENMAEQVKKKQERLDRMLKSLKEATKE